MPRIEPLAGTPTDPAVAELLEFAEQNGVPNPDAVRIFARSEVGAAFVRAWQVAFFSGLLPHRLKELVRIRMSVGNECGYCSSIISKRAEQDGVTQETVLEVFDIDGSVVLAESEKAALRYAVLYAGEDELVDSDDLFAELRRHFSDEEILELGCLCSILHGSLKFMKSLRVVSWAEACELNPALAAVTRQPAARG